MKSKQLLASLSLIVLTTVLVTTSRSADEGNDTKRKSADEQRSLLLNILASPLDFSIKSDSAINVSKSLEDEIRKRYADDPEHFSIRMVGNALQADGITQNQRITGLEMEGKSVAEILTAFAVSMNPIRAVRDPASQNQKLVWTIGFDPKDVDKKQVILITTRGAAMKNGLAIPEVFLRDDVREGRLKLTGVQLQKKPREKDDKRIKTATGLYWPDIISAETLEDEIKAIKLRIDRNVTTPSRFAGRDYKACRVEFNQLAVLFAVSGAYDKEVRWKEDAPVARDLFARTAKHCKVGSIQSFQSAKSRKNDLADLFAGNGIKARDGKVPEREGVWPTISDRVPLMQRMDTAFSKTLKEDCVDARAFRANQGKIRHEAEIISLNASVIVEEGQPDADDHEYKLHALALSSAARRLSSAAKARDFEAGAAALEAIERSCARCHDDWR